MKFNNGNRLAAFQRRTKQVRFFLVRARVRETRATNQFLPAKKFFLSLIQKRPFRCQRREFYAKMIVKGVSPCTSDTDHRGLEAAGAYAFSEIAEKSFLEENARITRAERVSALLRIADYRRYLTFWQLYLHQRYLCPFKFHVNARKLVTR